LIFGALLLGCSLVFGTSVAVVNDTDQTLYLQVGEATWLVPPRTSGIGPTDLDFPSRNTVRILLEDCRRFESIGLSSAKTINIVRGASSRLTDGTSGITEPLPRADGACPAG
jgi:hypothetical protein